MSSRENAADAQANAAGAVRGRLFLLRAAATFAALAAWQLSGASARLLDGLNARFDDAWWPVHVLYLAIALSGLGVLMVPFSLYEDFTLEERETGEETDFTAWTLDLAKVMGIDLLSGVGFFLALYGLIEYLPRGWWIAAAILYGLVNFAIVVIPMFQGPPEDELGELRDPVLQERLDGVLRQSGQPAIERLRWMGEGADEQYLLALQGVGRRRRIIISDGMLRDFTVEEIAALLAHEAAHLRNFDTTRLNVMAFLAALAGFAATHAVARLCTAWWDAPPAGELASFPVFAGALLGVSFAGMPFLNAFSRRCEYIADAVAGRLAGEIPLREALEKLNQGGPAAAPATTFDLLLHSHPNLAQRIWRLRGGSTKP